MADIDNVLERVVTDTAFRAQLGSDPAAALAGYDLSADDLQLLASSLDTGDQGQRGVEQRTSKSAVLGLLASLSGGGGGGSGGVDAPPDDLAAGERGPRKVEIGALKAGDTSAKHLGNPKIGEATLSVGGSDDLAAPDDAAATGRLPGKPKPGEITLTRVSSGDTAPPDEEVARVTGQKKYSNIVLKRGADTARAGMGTDAPPDLSSGEEPSLAFKQGFPVKWEGPSVSATDGLDVEKVAPPPPDDFLTIEDE